MGPHGAPLRLPGGQVGEVISGLREMTKGHKEAFGNNNEPPGDD